MAITNVRVLPSLQFKDGSTYSGQVLSSESALPVPHGYGVLSTSSGFTHSGHFQQGKAHGRGIFRAPNGDVFYGQWGDGNKREGKGLFVRGSDGLQLVEEYRDGKLEKRVKRRPPPAGSRHWLPSTRGDGGLQLTGSGPCARAGHSCTVTADEAMLVVFGGETVGESGVSSNLNDLHLLELQSRCWLSSPPTSGSPPPPMRGHSATLVRNHLLIIIGGQLSGMDTNSSVFQLDLNTGEWTTLLSHSLPFTGHSSAYVASSHSIYTLQHDRVFAFSLDSRQWTECRDDRRGLMRSPRSFTGHSCVAVGSDVWVVGGKAMGGAAGGGGSDGKRYEKCIAEIRVLHTDSLSWSVVASLPAPRTDCMLAYSAACPSLLHIVGGLSTLNPALHAVDESWLDDCLTLHLPSLQFLPSPSALCFPTPRAEGSAVVVGNRLWLFGGRNAGQAVCDSWDVLELGDMTGGVEERKEQMTGSTVAVAAAASVSTGSFTIVQADEVAGTGSVLEAFRMQQSRAGG